MKPVTRETKRTLLRAAACGFLLAALWSFFPFAASCAGLPENVVRLHVVANSDSEKDQAVKLKVRDAVLAEAAKWCENSSSMEETTAALCVHAEAIRTAANRTLLENGFSETASVQVTDAYFPTRDYGDFSLPAGKYRTLRVTIGKGEGKNWWCVVFPALCLPAAEKRGEDPLAFLPGSQREAVENPKKYRVSFKAVEIYEQLKEWLNGG